MSSQLSALIEEIPKLEERFETMAGGISIIYRDRQFNEWRGRVLLLLDSMPKTGFTNTISTLLNSMNGHNDVETFYRVTGMLKAMNQSDETKSQVRLKKGTVISTAFSNYKLVSQVGQGGNGTVWEAVDESNRQVAIKLLDRGDVRKTKRFKNEAVFCMKHEHKNIVPVSDYGAIGEEYSFYVMPLYQTTLRQRINQGLDGATALSIFIGIIEGLKFAHDNKVIHRDIKPENIFFLKDSDEPVIADFGIAHFSEDELATAIETKQSERMANFQYAAPEQRQRGAAVGPQADLYAAGLILNEMFTKEVPSALEYKKIEAVAADYSYLDSIVGRLYVQSPEKRIQTAGEVLFELKIMADGFAKRKEKEALEKAVIEASAIPQYSVSVKNIKLSHNELVFELNNRLPGNWQHYLEHCHHTMAFLLGYGHEQLYASNYNTLIMPLHGGEDADQIKQIAGYVKTWVGYISIDHQRALEAEANAQRAEREERRKNEIKRLEREMEINSMLATI